MDSGLLFIEKPADITSFEVIRILRKKLNIRKMGHAGTLDPFATGLLVVALNEATKALSEFLLDTKEYIAEICFGKTSTTDDPEGEIVQMENVSEFSEAELTALLQEQFVGMIEQIPPAYSALKIQGKRAADRVRAGEDIQAAMEQKKRMIEISSIEIMSFTFPLATILVRCSSGTYIRTLGKDIGAAMQTGAYVTKLRRTKVGVFDVANAIEPEAATRQHIHPLKSEYFPFPSIQVSEEQEKDLRMGRKIEYGEMSLLESTKILLMQNKSVVGFGIAVFQKGLTQVQPKKIFND